MPLQNRVLPSGEITAIPSRGTLTGNRGIIHRDDKTLGTSRWTHHAWICCTLDWQGRKRPVMTGRNWTELFFLDEATAFAAGHRPCGYCRRDAYAAYRDAWAKVAGMRMSAKQMDSALHADRVDRTRRQITYPAVLETLPDGVFVQHENQPHLWLQKALLPYTPDGYLTPIAPKTETITKVMTPLSTVEVLRAGFAPQLHATAKLPKT